MKTIYSTFVNITLFLMIKHGVLACKLAGLLPSLLANSITSITHITYIIITIAATTAAATTTTKSTTSVNGGI